MKASHFHKVLIRELSEKVPQVGFEPLRVHVVFAEKNFPKPCEGLGLLDELPHPNAYGIETVVNTVD